MLVCHQDDICENSIGSVYDGGYCGQSESRFCAAVKGVLSAFL